MGHKLYPTQMITTKHIRLYQLKPLGSTKHISTYSYWLGQMSTARVTTCNYYLHSLTPTNHRNWYYLYWIKVNTHSLYSMQLMNRYSYQSHTTRTSPNSPMSTCRISGISVGLGSVYSITLGVRIRGCVTLRGLGGWKESS